MKTLNNVNALQLFQVMRFGTLILIGIVLVKADFTLDEIGNYELFFLLANVLSFFWSMGLKNALISFYPSLEPDKKRRLFFNIGILLFVLGIVAGFGLLILEPTIARIMKIGGEIKYLWLIIAYMVLSAPANFTEYIYLLLRKSKSIVVYGFAIFLLQFLLICLGVYFQWPVKSLLQLMVLWAALKFLWNVGVVLRYADLSFDNVLITTFLLFGFPLILQMLLGNGMDYVDGFLVNHFFDEATFAQFRYGARELPLATVLLGAISTAMIPLAVTNINAALKDVKTRIRKMILILFPISMGLMLISPYAFPFFYSDEFRVSAEIFNIYLLILGSRILMPQVVLFAKHENVVLMLSAFAELILNITLSIVFLNLFGLQGIAWATVLAYFLNKSVLATFAWYKYKIKPSDYLNIKLYGFWFLLLVITYYISTLYN